MNYELEYLTECYTQSHRFYHTLEHIGFMFQTAKNKGIVLTYDQKQAIWWHDAAYLPMNSQNEVHSIYLMKQNSEYYSREVEKIILNTIYHIPTEEYSKVVLDLDLAILASSHYPNYNRYVNQVRKEYLDSGKISAEQFDNGRKRWVTDMLSSDKIFHSDYFKLEEKIARVNLERELRNYD